MKPFMKFPKFFKELRRLDWQLFPLLDDHTIMSPSPFIVSAPGKVIIFGEHSAVYGKPAIAAALSLRCYLLATPNENSDIIRLEFPDIELSYSWKKSDLPWELIKSVSQTENGVPKVSEELVPEITQALSSILSDVNSKMHHTACFCFLYLYCNLCDNSTPGMTFSVRSTLPIGAGLGSSASTSVCLAAALATLGGWVSKAELTNDDHVPSGEPADLHFIDSWSLIGEKCFHGNPSGVDNAVATHGGAVMFQRSSQPRQPSVRTAIRNFPPVKLLLTNTKVPRSTAELVGGVGKRHRKYTKTSSSILDAMGHLATEAHEAIITPSFGESEHKKLLELVDINHGLLVALGVSHPVLEKVRIISDVHKIGATKLTGAGGGGCAITLINDNASENDIEDAIVEFEKEGFECFKTCLGGKGVGILYSEDVPLGNDTVQVFSTERFSSYEDRNEIEKALGVNIIDEWRFW